MAITLRNGAVETGTAVLATTLTINKPSGTVAGETMIAGVQSLGARTWSAPAGWARIPGATAGVSTDFFYKVAGGSEPSSYGFTVTGGTSTLRGCVGTYQGADPVTPFDGDGVIEQPAAGTSVVTPAISPATAGCTLFGMALRAGSNAAITPPGSMSTIFTSTADTQYKIGAIEVLPSAGSTGTRTWTWTGTSNVGTMLVAFRNPSTNYEEDLDDTATASDAAVKAAGKNATDTATATDTPSKTSGKPLADTAAATDALSKQPSKPLADTATATDLANVLPSKGLADTATATDAPVKAVGKTLADSATATDAPVISLGANSSLGDSVTPTDSSIAKTIGKTLDDTTTADDLAVLVSGKGVSLDDTAPATDEIIKTVGKGLADSSTPADVAAKNLARSLADTATVTDNLSVSRGTSETLNDTATTADALVKQIGKSAADLVTPVDGTSTETTTQRFLADTATAADDITVSRGIWLELSDLLGCADDFPVTTPSRNITGVVYDHESAIPGTVIVGATVRLFRTQDDAICQVTTTNALGEYEFLRDAADPYTYYVTVQVDGPVQVHGISDRGLIPEPV